MKQKTLLFLCALLVLEIMIFPVIMLANDNPLKKNDQWWKEFIQAQPAPGHTQNSNALANDDQWWQQFVNVEQEPQESWYKRNKESLQRMLKWVCVCCVSVFCLKMYIKRRIRLLRQRNVSNPGVPSPNRPRQARLAERIRNYSGQQLELLEANEQLSNLENKMGDLIDFDRKHYSLLEDPDLVRAVEGSDVVFIKQIFGDNESTIDLIKKLAACHAKYACSVCSGVCADTTMFNVGSPHCFHFMCTPCYSKWQNSTVMDDNPHVSRSNDGRRSCPQCRK